MSHETLTAGRALELLREVVAERPDYRYESPVEGACVYIDPGDRRPSCLVGHVLVRAGWDLGELELSNQTDVLGLFERHPDSADDDAACLLQEAQSSQDAGDTWATALAVAEARAGWSA